MLFNLNITSVKVVGRVTREMCLKHSCAFRSDNGIRAVDINSMKPVDPQFLKGLKLIGGRFPAKGGLNALNDH